MDSFIEGNIEEKFDNKNLFRRSRPETSLKFDYEVNGLELSEHYGQIIAYDRRSKEIIDFNNFYDTINGIDPDGPAKRQSNNLFKANIFKRLTSKKKRRIQNENFDLDMAYITKRILAMGYPSTGCETIYRNSLKDAKTFLNKYHEDYKIYNLCLESGRIYDKEVFNGKKVGLFPFMDHEPCPIKLMLELCTDICIYLSRNKNGIAVLHCKAGKGRTGLMIICYLIFSGLCKNITEAVAHYAKQRTLNNKGVTIPSQIRYIQYFETFLSTNFKRPYYRMIPQIIRFYITPRVVNTLRNYLQENDYFYTSNNFKLKHLTIGPFKKEVDLKITISSLINKNILFPKAKCLLSEDPLTHLFTINISFNSDRIFNYDIQLTCSKFRFKFNCWVNLWFSTMENISKYIMKNEIDNYSPKRLMNKGKDEDIISDNNKSVDQLIELNDKLKDEQKIYSDMMKMMESIEDSEEKFEEVNNNDNNMKENLLSSKTKNYSVKNEEKCENNLIITNKALQINELTGNPDKQEPIKLEKKETIESNDSTNRTKLRINKTKTFVGLINELKEDKNLIHFINGLNKRAFIVGNKPFDMENQKIKLTRNKLDKFKDSFNIVDDSFYIEYTFSLLEDDDILN